MTRKALLIERQEEYIRRIQAGERQLIPELWELLKPLTARFVRHYMNGHVERLFDDSDLWQESFLALDDALRYFKPDGGASFATCYAWAFKTATRHLRGACSHDALIRSTSLNQPINDDDDGELGDVLPDTDAEDAFDNAEGNIFLHDLQATFADIDCQLSDVQRQAVDAKFRRRESAASACEQLGISAGEYKAAVMAALRVYRRPANAARLKPFTNLYNGTGLTAFKRRGASCVELAVERAEKQ